MRVGSFWGMMGALGTTSWPRPAKKSRNVRRIWEEVVSELMAGRGV
jgi:hypothetical protein